MCEFVFAFPQFCLHEDLCVRAHTECAFLSVCVCMCEKKVASACACMTHESSRPGPWRVQKRGAETTVRPATVALTCQRCQSESIRVVEGKFKKNSDTFLFHTTLGQRSASLRQTDGSVSEKRD